MLIRPHDDGTEDETRWRSFVEAQGFGHFVASGTDRDIPVVVPTQFLLKEHQVVFHLARPNPVFAALAENPRCLLSIAGDWDYIPGSWRTMGDEDPRLGIPTTYYGAVQLTCTATVIDDPEQVAAILRTQVAALEPGNDYVDPTEHAVKLRAIRGLVLSIDQVRAKFKYGDNADDAHREHVVALLAAKRT